VPALPEVSLLRASPGLSYDSVSLHDARFDFCFCALAASSSLATRLAFVFVHTSRRAWPARSPRLTAIRARRSHGSRPEHPLLRDEEWWRPRSSSTNVSNPRFCFQETGTLVSVHSASRIPTRRSGSRFTPYRASPGEHACLSRALSSRAASTCVPSMLRHRTGPRQNARFGRPKPSSTNIASTGVARCSCAEALELSGYPPMV